ncbi:uncharacterized protein LOC117570000 [Drosophila albomicans]|uniref:Uncharacterized protein LOC117570000 n=1 Tax=Drosophila albomicans TaxID=7291 RepID=A0A6P8YKB7_DROAB|nr:uncharacterized protein LOC117570000 [Drosophila albomicans]
MKTSDQEMDEESVQHNVEATKVLEQNGGGEVKAESSSESESQRILSGATAMSTSIRNVGSSSTNVDHADIECGLTAQYIADGLCSMRRDQRILAMLMINIIMNRLIHRQQRQGGNGDAK